jgi:hypothetical protein
VPDFSFMRNRPSANPSPDNRLRDPSSGQQASSVYNDFYGQMPVPAPQMATSVTALSSLEVTPSVRTIASNATVVDRHWRRNGLVYTAGRQSSKGTAPQQPRPVRSSNFSKWLIGPQVNYIMNDDWYIAYPAATVMFGGDRNLGLSTRVDQLPTRTSGGPGPATMRPAPRFTRVQQVPRYSVIPPQYPTQSTQG